MTLQKISALSVVWLLGLPACRSRDSQSSELHETVVTAAELVDSEGSISKSNLNYDLILSIGGPTAQSVFNSLAINAATPGKMTRVKAVSGGLAVDCGFSSLNEPQVGKGVPSAKAECQFKKQELLFALGGEAAAEVYEELNVPEFNASEKTWSGRGQLSCSHYLDEDSYYCELLDMDLGKTTTTAAPL